MVSNAPTNDTYGSILHAYDFFNQALFDGKLPSVIVTYHRQRRVMGYASIARWVNSESKCIDELAVNPEYFAKYPLIEICQTLCHEMTHIWQAHFGTPGRRGYHNVQWKKKMESIGLMPSSTGKPGGKTTGEAMMDYVLFEGLFITHFKRLMENGYELPWVDRYPVFRLEVPLFAYSNIGEAIELEYNFGINHLKKDVAKMHQTDTKDEQKIVFDDDSDRIFQSETQTISPFPTLTSKPPQSSGRVKYCCKSCHVLVWGKPKLRLGCLDCNIQMQVII